MTHARDIGGAAASMLLSGHGYCQIAAAFDELFEHADHNPTRPLIEFYRREGEVNCLVPVNAAVTGA